MSSGFSPEEWQYWMYRYDNGATFSEVPTRSAPGTTPDTPSALTSLSNEQSPDPSSVPSATQLSSDASLSPYVGIPSQRELKDVNNVDGYEDQAFSHTGMYPPSPSNAQYPTDQSRLQNGKRKHPTAQPRLSSPPSKRSRFKSQDLRRQTHETRLAGACIRCRRYNKKRRCAPGPDPNGPTAPFAPTLRWAKKEPGKDGLLFSAIKASNSRRSRPPTEVQLSQGDGRSTLTLRVHEYTPSPRFQDKQHYTWYEGSRKHYFRTTPFDIADVEFAQAAIERFIDRHTEEYVEHIFLGKKNAPGQIMKAAFQMALSKRQESPLIASVLRFWVAARLIETPWKITGEEKLGMSPDTTKSSPYFGVVPVTPIMDFQIDNIVIHGQLNELLKRVRRGLIEKSLAGKKEDWFDIQLTMFVLLNHADMVMGHDVEFAKRNNLPERFSHNHLINKIYKASNTLLTYFHYANKGYFPFTAPWEEVQQTCSLNDEQKNYINKIRALLPAAQEYPQLPGEEFYWTSQMHREGWRDVAAPV
ncbi:MAG: hypothetical protein M1833_005255 [Piccolia ochrophora]|nr:MAG: hypothetical protein M1833_005255 [Piccolia ochrophora]